MAVATNETTAVVATPLPGLALLNNNRRIGIVVAVAAIVALLVGAVLWGQSPDYRVLYTNVSDRDGGAIIASLQQMNVPYKFAEGGGALLVPSNMVHETRLRLAAQGLPKGSVVGFELMENQKFGVSQFAEQINYQRGLEGELARSVQSLSAVQSARVHLALPKQSVFAREQQKPSASVLVNLYAGRTLDEGQVNAIVHLVSSSVPELPVKGVTVVDQNGNLLSATEDGPRADGLDPAQLKFQRELEQSYVNRIEAILTPIMGPGNARAQVAADIDFSNTEQVAESYKPNNKPVEQSIRSQQSSDQSNAGGAPAGGVPGALSNQPPVNPTAAINAPAAGQPTPAPSAPTSTHKDLTTNYELDKTVRHTTQPMGGIKRLSVAVVVNYRKDVGKDGKVTWKPLTQAEKTQISDLVKQAMGFNQKRGDTVNVANNQFQGPETETVPEPPWWKRPEMIPLAKEIGKYLLIAGVVLYLVLGVLRPLLNKLAEPPATPGDEDEEDDAEEGADGDDGRRGALPAPNEDGSVVQVSSYQEKLAQAKQLAKQDPQVVAAVVRDWVSGNE
jgi:flagellar M-ring protein FliF